MQCMPQHMPGQHMPAADTGPPALLLIPPLATDHWAASGGCMNVHLGACRGHAPDLRPPSSSAHSRSSLRTPPAQARDQSWAASEDHQPPGSQAQHPTHHAHHHKHSSLVPEAAADRLGMPLPPQHLPWQNRPHAGPDSTPGMQALRHGSAQSVQARQQTGQALAQQPGLTPGQPRACLPNPKAASAGTGAWDADLHPDEQAKAWSPEQGSWAAAGGSCQSHTPRHIREHSFERVSNWAAASAAHSSPASGQVPAAQAEPMQPLHSRSRGGTGPCLPAQQRDKWGQAVHSLDSLPGSGRIGVWSRWSPGRSGSWAPHLETCLQHASPRTRMGGSSMQPAAPGDWLAPVEATGHRGSRRHKQASAASACTWHQAHPLSA